MRRPTPGRRRIVVARSAHPSLRYVPLQEALIVDHVVLVPGFFGFADFGQLGYFTHVRRTLEDRARARARTLRTHVVPTSPTASLVTRARHLLDVLARLDDGPIHLVGHSTGGLDARIATTSSFARTGPHTTAVERVRTVVTVATPHRGTPIARLFQGVRGRRWLRALSIATLITLRTGDRPVKALVKLAAGVRAAADRTVGTPDLVDEVFHGLLDRFDDQRRAEVERFFTDVGADTSLVGQLTPEAMGPVHALAPERPGVRYASVVTRAPEPRLRTSVKAGPRVGRQAAIALYSALWTATGRGGLPLRLSGDAEEALRLGIGHVPGPKMNDAIVPTRSQPWGRVLAVVQADHLDVLGHFADRQAHPPHYDWLPSGAGFDREAFNGVWARVAELLLR